MNADSRTGAGGPWSTSRLVAVIEVTLVLATVVAAVAGVTRLGAAGLVRQHLHRPFLEYLAIAVVVAGVITASRVSLASCGLSAKGLPALFEAGLKCMVPFAVGNALSFPLGSRAALHSLAEPLIVAGVVTACAWLLRAGPAPSLAAGVVGLAVAVNLAPARALSALVFFAVVLGPIEELLFRGYIQSRLNRAWGRPWRVGKAPCGAGLLITAGLFSAFHVLNLPLLLAGQLEPLWVAAIPTCAWGLAFGYLRERTGSLIPPALAHGMPQAIAWVFLGR